MNDLIIYGAGGFGREVALLIEQINEAKYTWNVLGFVDDGIAPNTRIDGLQVLGGLNYLHQCKQPMNIVIAIAQPLIRKTVAQSLVNKLFSFPTLIHPSANMGSSFRNNVGDGSIIAAFNVLTTGITVGNFTIINLGCTIGHDVALNNFCTVMPGCNISGNVKIGEGTLVGTGSQILQNLSIGSACKIGAGAVVTKNFGDGLTLLGVPARSKK